MVMVSKVHAFMEVSTEVQGPGGGSSPQLRPVGQHGVMFSHICKRVFAQVMQDEALAWSRGRRTSPSPPPAVVSWWTLTCWYLWRA